MIVHAGRVVMRWGDRRRRYDIKSATKSFGATMLGVALRDGLVELDAPARRYHPKLCVPPESNVQTGWLDEITLRRLATQTAGFDKPGGYQALLFRPGSQWHYSDCGPNWLAECLTLVYRRDLDEVMFERVFTPLGVTRDDPRWRENQYRDHKIDGIPRREFGAGIHADVEALSRLGYLYLHRGRWKNQQILSPEFVGLASRPSAETIGLPERTGTDHGDASEHYGLLWWNNGDGALVGVPQDAYWAWGLYDSLVVVIPSLDLVVVRGGESGRSLPRSEVTDHFDVLAPLLQPIVAAIPLPEGSAQMGAPYPRSSLITAIDWAPTESILRFAEGSDNWPLTWADDDALYTAYGDGWGFEPRVERKLSLGLARVNGALPEIQGENLRSVQVEQIGQGAAGKKGSGILMVDGVLYLLVRNADNAQLAWSQDSGKTWTWADWRWTTSFGCPTFLNFGKNYQGARDDYVYVYVYSHDSNSAYQPADRMVLARVPRNQVHKRDSYEFFQGTDRGGRPRWTTDEMQRGAVFEHAGACYRSGVSYHPGLRRYLWCQIHPTSRHPRGPRYQGGFGVYDAPEPWGPWNTVYFTKDWDVGPGETASFPTKWMSADGRTIHLVFSGDDCFSVRQAKLSLAVD